MASGAAVIPSLLARITVLFGKGKVSMNRNIDPQRLASPALRGCPRCTEWLPSGPRSASSSIQEAKFALTFSLSPAVNTVGHTFPLKQDSWGSFDLTLFSSSLLLLLVFYFILFLLLQAHLWETLSLGDLTFPQALVTSSMHVTHR